MTDTPVSSMVWVAVGAVIGSLGAAALKAGSAHVKLEIVSLVKNWQLFLGVGLYLVSTVFYNKGIAHGEISVLFPLVSIGYIFSSFWSKMLFGEKMTKEKYLGLALIVTGCVVLGLGGVTKAQ